MEAHIKSLVAEFSREAKRLYGARLARVVLFGSYARGDFRDESDLDLMVVLHDDPLARYPEIDRLSGLVSRFSLDYGLTVSVLPVSERRFWESEVPVYAAARKEGLPLGNHSRAPSGNVPSTA
jgi:predicted nucleotidyltransferase